MAEVFSVFRSKWRQKRDVSPNKESRFESNGGILKLYSKQNNSHWKLYFMHGKWNKIA